MVGGGNTPSNDITIDDVVKFIHDEVESFRPGFFPYTTWDDIPDYLDADNGDFCKTNMITGQTSFSQILLNIPQYVIIKKGESIVPVG